MRALAVGLAMAGMLGGCDTLGQEEPRHPEMKQKGLGSMMGPRPSPYGRPTPALGAGGLMGPGLSMVRPGLRGGANLTTDRSAPISSFIWTGAGMPGLGSAR